MHCRIAVWGAYHLFFCPLLEYFVHVHSGLLQHLIPDVGVDVGGGLVVGMPDNKDGCQKNIQFPLNRHFRQFLSPLYLYWDCVVLFL